MKLPTVSELVKNKTVKFSFYRDGELWYKVDGTSFEFPITGEDLKGATFIPEDKALLFMRFIRKHLNYLKKTMEEEGIVDNKPNG